MVRAPFPAWQLSCFLQQVHCSSDLAPVPKGPPQPLPSLPSQAHCHTSLTHSSWQPSGKQQEAGLLGNLSWCNFSFFDDASSNCYIIHVDLRLHSKGANERDWGWVLHMSLTGLSLGMRFACPFAFRVYSISWCHGSDLSLNSGRRILNSK